VNDPQKKILLTCFKPREFPSNGEGVSGGDGDDNNGRDDSDGDVSDGGDGAPTRERNKRNK
jgi:hypothetical protein